MNDKKENPYTGPMLPDVDYQQFNDGCFRSLVDLESSALEKFHDLLEGLEQVLLKKNLVQMPELIVTHMCFYLGSVTAMYEPYEAKRLKPIMINMLKQHADLAYAKFNKYPVNSSVEAQHEKQANLSKLETKCPGSIAIQTVRLGRIIMDMMQRLGMHREITIGLKRQTPEELFCPQDEFFDFMIPLADEQYEEWENLLGSLGSKSMNYALNQLTLQIGWLIGYFAHLDSKPPDEGQYLEYGLHCFALYLDNSQEAILAEHNDEH